MDYTDHPLRDALPLGEGFGRGLRRIRDAHGLTLDKVASAATFYGLKWSTARVVEFEKGRIPITLPTLMRLGTALTVLTRESVTLSDLLDWDHWLELPGGGVIHALAFRQAFAGGPIDLRQGDREEFERDLGLRAHDLVPDVPEGMTVRQLRFMHEYMGIADERAAKRLGLTVDQFLAYCFPLFGLPLSEYRNSRLGFEANAQQRGRLTRWLTALVADLAERHKAGEPEAVELMSSLGVVGYLPPIADRLPEMRQLRKTRRLKNYADVDTDPDFVRFGLSDLGIDKLAEERWLVSLEEFPYQGEKREIFGI